MSFPLPPNERARLDALERYQLEAIDSAVALDRIAEIAKRLFVAPIALVTIVDEVHQRFVSHLGLDLDGTGRDDSFCTHALIDTTPLVVPDTLEDERFVDNALVVGEPGVRFYAGAPIVTGDGYGLGSVCVLDTEPRGGVDPAQMAILEMLAEIAMDTLEQRFHALRLVTSLERIRSTVGAMEDGVKS